MKALIPVAGVGSRLRPHTHTQPKALIPVAGKAILGHIVEDLIDHGIEDFVFIIGHLGNKIEAFIAENYANINTHFVLQSSSKGNGHALSLAKNCVNQNEDLLIVFGDTIAKCDYQKILAQETSQIGLQKVQNPELFGVAEISPEGWVTKLIEKPKIPTSNMAMVGVYYIKESHVLFDCLEEMLHPDQKEKKEYHLTQALDMMVQKGIRIKTFGVQSWFDCGKKEVLLETNRKLLKSVKQEIPKGACENCIFIEPYHVGNNAQIENCIIGPHVSIGENAILENSIISDSIIGPNSHIQSAILAQSVVGNDAALSGLSLSLNLGDSTEIALK